MGAIDAEGFRGLVETAITAVSMLGGIMAYTSGFAAAQGFLLACDPTQLAARINVGVAKGFLVGPPVAAITITLEAWI